MNINNLIINSFQYPKENFIQQWSIDWTQFTEAEFISTFNYWIGSLSNIQKDHATFINLKNGRELLVGHSIPSLVEGNCLVYLSEVEKEYGIMDWWMPISDEENFKQGDKLLKHLYLLWHNENLPLQKGKLTKQESKAAQRKHFSLSKISMQRGYDMQNWPNFGDKSWILPPTSKIIKFD